MSRVAGFRSLSIWLRRVALLLPTLGVLVAAGCGGGGGVGSGGTGAPVAEGAVTGFGSVFVDGVRYDDSLASAPEIERIAGQRERLTLQLGHHVVLGFDGDVDSGVRAHAIEVEPDIIGHVESIDLANGRLTVLGQVVVVNTDPSKGPVTQFAAPWTGLSSVAVGAGIEVHGALRSDVPDGTQRLMATRLEPRSVSPSLPLRVAGVVTAANGSLFQIGTLKVDASLVQTRVSVGQTVVVFANANALDDATRTLTASEVRIKSRVLSLHDGYLGGVIDLLSVPSRTFLVRGVLVDYSGASIEARSGLANGDYVRVLGRFVAANRVIATRVTVRSDGSDDNGGEAELHGSIAAFDAVNHRFTVRGQMVDASGVEPIPPGCVLQNYVYVEVKGTMTTAGVRARTIECKAEVTGNIVSRKGVVSASTASQFKLSSERGTYTVLIGSSTVFEDHLSAPLRQGATVDVEGELDGSTIRARRIKSEEDDD